MTGMRRSETQAGLPAKLPSYGPANETKESYTLSPHECPVKKGGAVLCQTQWADDGGDVFYN